MDKIGDQIKRVFDALAKNGKIFDRYDPQSFWETVEVGAKNYLSG